MRKLLRKYANCQESMRKCARSWESVLEVEKVCKKLKKCARSWESMLKVEKVV